jgi:(1->4)-alpha-D-glucan 1-alpha-D-glucosylmutase
MSIPRATYRIQLHRGFGFRDAAAVVPYLSALGVSHVYCSPYLRARSGSLHGYDIIGHHELNPEIGTRADFDAFVAALKAHGMGQIMDVVPNHMGVMAADNAWWMDVLENGEASAYADFFDIDWHPASAHLANRLLVPVLGGHYGAILEAGELALAFDAASGAFSILYQQHRFPVDPRTYPLILRSVAADLDDLADGFRQLPPREATGMKAQRTLAKDGLKRKLALACADPGVAMAIEGAVRSCNGIPGNAASFDALHALLDAQAYRLAYWRVASDEINYRRFFDINELAALRMERPEVFEATHEFIFDLVREGAVDGLRIDHPDGLYDPAGYFRRLQEKYASVCGTGIEPRRPLYVVVEKIVASFENMPENWAVHGSTGYRFANLVNGLFVDESAARAFTRLYSGYSGVSESFEDVAMRSRHLILRTALASELTVLANRLARIAHAQRATRDYTLNTLRQALAEVIASFPVYRTYLAEQVSADDRRWIEWAAARAKRHTRAADASIFDFIRGVLLSDEQPMRDFAMKFQQLTAPVMAKGVEDTSFYIYARLVSLNDVGADPAAFGYGVNAFHGASADRAAKWPHTMLATSTHDNKRSEDVRARIDVLSELPAAWRLNLRRWSRMNRSKKRLVDGMQAPSRNDEYLLYQTLLGSLPLSGAKESLDDYAGRIETYMLKAAREAKVHTSWINPNHEYEAAIAAFVHGLLRPGRNLFLERLRTAAGTVGWLGMLNSLSMTVLKLTSPGVPDIYQGTELEDFSLVDPDNRRPVDYAVRRALLARLPQDPKEMREMFRAPLDGRPKLFVISRLLAFRRENPDLFFSGGYLPVHASGRRRSNVVAFARTGAARGLVTAATRLHSSLGIGEGELPCGESVWGDTAIDLSFLAEGTRLRHLFTGTGHTVRDGKVRLAEVFSDVPAGVLAY